MGRRPLRAPAEHGPAVALARRLLATVQHALYARLFRVSACGAAPAPCGRPFLVVANHASHLDMGLVKYALGPAGRELGSLAAKDYFFASPLSRYYFATFTNLIPMNRGRGFAESVRATGHAFQAGRSVMLFPEGGRTRTGAIAAFKPAAGFLALKNKVDVLPVYITGVYEALPRGALLPRSRVLAAHLGAPLTHAELARATRHLADKEAFHEATAMMERAVRRLAEEHARRCGGHHGHE